MESSVVNEEGDDRPYLKVKLGDTELIGLVDSGCNIVCLGKGSLKLLESLHISYTPLESSLKTAGGSCKTVIGFIRQEIIYNKRSQEFTIFICPELQQKLYLGANFIRAFNLAPMLFPPRIEELLPNDPNKHELSDAENMILLNVFSKFPSSEILGLGKTYLEEHHIDTKDCPPIKSRCYPVSPAVQKLIYEEVDKMLKSGVIEPCESPWASPVTLVRKPTKNRLCLDFRKVNKVTEKLAYPIPNMEGLMSRLSNTKYISSVDLKDAFFQIPLDMASREKTAFVIPGRPLYQFTVMPFGLCNAPQRMSKLMDKVIPEELKDHVFVYMDDLLIVTPDFATHLDYLDKVAVALKRAGLTINVSKSRFCFKELKYLGFIVADGTLKTDPDKVNAVLNFPVPKTKRQVRGFLGLSGWYRRFIKDFAAIAAPLSDTLQGKVFSMTEEAVLSFKNLQEALTNAPVLRNPDFNRTFHIQCDASDSGMGGVLFQLDDDGMERPIYYFSAKLNAAQRNYSVTERECLAVVKSVEKFRPYVEGYHFQIITDHSSLKWLMSTRDLSGKLARWSLKLQSYDFDITHRKGNMNLVPDCLSRTHDSVVESLQASDSDDMVNLVLDFNDPAFSSEEYTELRLFLTDNTDQLPDFLVSDGFIYKKTEHCTGVSDILDLKVFKLWIPSPLRKDLISSAHDPPNKSHGGISKTIHRLRDRFYWPYLAEDVRNYIKDCQKCTEIKSPNHVLKSPLGKTFQVDKPFQHLYADFLGPYPRTKRGNTKIFIILDHLTKFIILEPIKSSKASIAIHHLKEKIFNTFGVPETFLTDNGPEFKSKEFERFLSSYGVEHLDTPKYHPQANASERVNRNIINSISCYIDSQDHSSWDLLLNEIKSAYLSSFHHTLKMSPFEALFGTTMVQHGSEYPLLKRLQSVHECGTNVLAKKDKLQILHKHLMELINKSNEASAEKYNLRTRVRVFLPGQEIYCRTFHLSSFKDNFNKKFAPKFRKCRILRQCGSNRYELEDLAGKSLGIYHTNDLKSA